jgi:hypothetical protein
MQIVKEVKKKKDARVGVFPHLFLTRKRHSRFVAPRLDRQKAVL